MTLYGKFLCFILIYLISDSKWILVQSVDTSATPPASSGGDGSTVKTDQNDGGIKLFGKDPNDDKKIVELNSEHYDLKELPGNRIDYELKSEVKCTSITIDGEQLWKHGDHKCDDDPKSVSYRHGDTIVIHLGNGFVQYRKSNNTWNVEFENNLKTSGEETPDPSSQDQSETRTSGGGGTDPSGGGTGTGGGGGGSRTGDGGTDGSGGTDQSSGGNGTGTGGKGEDSRGKPSGGGGPTSGGTGLLSCGDGSSARPASSVGDGTSATPGHCGTTTLPISGGTEPETKTGVDLSLKAKKATPQFNYNKAGRVVTYTAKDNIGFKSVKTGDKVVWSTTNASEYATKVVLYGKGKKQKEVTIHMPNGTTKVFKRDGKGKPWTGVSQQNNQDNGQPGSGTPASGSNGMTGGHSMPYGSSSPMTGNGYGMTGGEGMRGDGHGSFGHGMSSSGPDPSRHGGRDRGSLSHNSKDGGLTYGHSGSEADGNSETEENEDEEDVEEDQDENNEKDEDENEEGEDETEEN